MKDIIIKRKFYIRELKLFLVMFIIAFLFNIYAIISFDTRWIELISQLHIMLLLAFIFYVIVAVFRIIAWFIRRLVKKSKATE